MQNQNYEGTCEGGNERSTRLVLTAFCASREQSRAVESRAEETRLADRKRGVAGDESDRVLAWLSFAVFESAKMSSVSLPTCVKERDEQADRMTLDLSGSLSVFPLLPRSLSSASILMNLLPYHFPPLHFCHLHFAASLAQWKEAPTHPI